MKTKTCPACGAESICDTPVCSHCGHERREGGTMLDSLVYWNMAGAKAARLKTASLYLFVVLTAAGILLHHPAPIIAGALIAAVAAFFKR